jgi:hypothetical protein
MKSPIAMTRIPEVHSRLARNVRFLFFLSVSNTMVCYVCLSGFPVLGNSLFIMFRKRVIEIYRSASNVPS